MNKATAIPELIEDKAIFNSSGLVLFNSEIGWSIKIKPITVPKRPSFKEISAASQPKLNFFAYSVSRAFSKRSLSSPLSIASRYLPIDRLGLISLSELIEVFSA